MNMPPNIVDREAEEAGLQFRFELPFPDKILWPNGRGHHMAEHRAFKKHKSWAHYGTLEAIGRNWRFAALPLKLHYIVTPKTAHAIDRDNAIAAMKAYQDGIALALAIDDKYFALPTLEFTAPRKPGRVEVVVG